MALQRTPSCAAVCKAITTNETTVSRCCMSCSGSIGSLANHPSVATNPAPETTPVPRRTRISGLDQGNLLPPISSGTRKPRMVIVIKTAPKKSILASLLSFDPSSVFERGLRFGSAHQTRIDAIAANGACPKKDLHTSGYQHSQFTQVIDGPSPPHCVRKPASNRSSKTASCGRNNINVRKPRRNLAERYEVFEFS